MISKHLSRPPGRLETIPGLGSTFPGPFSGDHHAMNDRVREGSHDASGTVIEWSATPSGYGSDPNTITPKSSWASILTQFDPTFTPPFPSFRFFKGLRRRAGLLAPQELGWLDCYWSG